MRPLPASLCDGIVGHTRHGPKPHALRYSMLSVLIDLERESRARKHGALWAVDGPALISVQTRDYGRGRGELRDWVVEKLCDAGLERDIGKIELLTAPRVFGLKFNPLSVFFAFDQEDELAGLVFEVSNFHGGRQAYAFPVPRDAGPDYRFSCEKSFFVSPYNTADEGEYHFRLRRDQQRLCLSIQLYREGERILSAVHSARLTRLNSNNLRSALLRHPFNTIKIVGGILVEALRLGLKGLPLHAPRRGTVDTRPRSA